MLSINNLSIQFGEKNLFRNVSVRVHPGERVGLAGVNGAGKSTLLKIMAGIRQMDAGVVVQAKRTTVGYLPQEVASYGKNLTLYQEAEKAFDYALSIQAQLNRLNERLETVSPDDQNIKSLLAGQGELQHQLDQFDIFRIRSQIEKILIGLGFKESDFEKECASFSGGWLTRLMLAKILLAKPSLILLDEPTNHLDIESLTWLEDFLKSYQGAMVIISHDRAFLDTVTNRTWELSLGNLTVFKGNYSKFLEEKQARMEIQRAAYENQQAKIQQTMRFVERFRAKSTKASQVQSRLRQLEKMERIELDESERKISFRFPKAPACGRLAVEVNHLAKNYDGYSVFNDIDFQLHRGEKLAVVGVNGAGKSTLAKLIAGMIDADSGEVRLGHNVILSYFGQHQAQELDPRMTVLETLTQITSELNITRIRSLLGAFLFSGEDVDKKVQVLSGGEKSRLALARMMASPANLLIMDEPTNHLDMVSQEVLQEAMMQYEGAIIVVSHNRFFLNSFINKVIEIKNGASTLYEGNVDDYLDKVRREREEMNTPPKDAGQNDAESTKQTRHKGKLARQVLAKVRQEKSCLLAPHKKVVKKAEELIEKLEATKSGLEQLLADPEFYKDQGAFSEKSKEYNEIEIVLEKNYQEWEAAQAKIDAIEAGFKEKLTSK